MKNFIWKYLFRRALSPRSKQVLAMALRAANRWALTNALHVDLSLRAASQLASELLKSR